MANITERRVWLLSSVVAMSAADIHELTSWAIADIEPLFDRVIASSTSTREAIECVFSRARGATIGSVSSQRNAERTSSVALATTVSRHSAATRAAPDVRQRAREDIERAVEAKQATLRAIFSKADALPWEELEALHLEQLGRLLLHADGRRSLERQLAAVHREERWPAAQRSPSRHSSVMRAGEVSMYAVITVSLDDIAPHVWRRISVPMSFTLSDLHDALQLAMGWTNSHLHQFMIGKTRYTTPAFEDDEEEPKPIDDSTVRLWDVLKRGMCLGYEYDFGDCWRHTLAVEDIVRGDGAMRLECLAGERACPPEDCGGTSGYAELVAALGNRRHPDHRALREWAPPDFDAARFDIDRVNALLRAYSAGRASTARRER